MAERRMFARTIIDSDAFLDMPISSQCLYFHLSMRADDDGFINNPKKIQRTVGCSEDDLTLLIAKKFIIPFQSGIVVIKHWKIHNYIQKDRYKATVYQEEKNMLGTKPNGSYKLLDTECIQNGYSLEAQVRLGKDSLGKDRIEIPPEILQIPDRIPYQKIVEAFNEICTSLTKVKELTESRKSTIKARYKDLDYSMDKVKEYFAKIQASDFLTGKVEREGKRPFKATFDWIIKPANYVKIIEGNYENKEASYGKHNAATDTSEIPDKYKNFYQ
jgi:hypothetical protein